jgi:hypothetical protein
MVSDEAPYLTGAEVVVDGGVLAWVTYRSALATAPASPDAGGRQRV